MNIDITLVAGTGAKGRVYKEDLVAHQQGGNKQNAPAPVVETVTVASQENRVEPIERA